MFCIKCNEAVTDFVTCQGSCSGKLHFGCAGISETSYRRMSQDKKSAWRCTSCRTVPPEAGGATLMAVMKELKEFRMEFKSMKDDVSSIKSEIYNTSLNIQELSTKLSDLDTRFDEMEERLVLVENKSDSYVNFQKKLMDSEQIIEQLRNENMQQDQFSRLNNLEIIGVPQRSSENLTTILRDISTKVGFSLKDTDVDTIHRVRLFNSNDNKRGESARHPSIIVRFTQRHRKNDLLAAVRARRGLTTADIGFDGAATPLFVNEHLTPANKLLLKQARARKIELNYAYLWIKDCKILLRKSDKSKIVRISTAADLVMLK